jgi:hypothetical protein
MSSKSSSSNKTKRGGVKTKTIKSSKKSSSGDESKKGGVKAKKPKSAKKSGLKSKKTVKKSVSKKPKSSKKKSSKRGGSHGYAQMFKSSLSPCYEGAEKKSWHGGMEKVVSPLGNDLMNRALLYRQVSPTFTMDDVQTVGPAEWAATRNESPLQDAKGEVLGWSSTDSGPAPVEPAPLEQGGSGKKKKTSSKKKSILGKTKNFLSSLFSKTKSVVKKSANFVKSKVSGDKKKKSTKKSVKKSTTTDKKKKVKSDKKKKAKKSVKKDK